MFHRKGKKPKHVAISSPYDFEKKEIDFRQDHKSQLQRDASVPLPHILPQRLPRSSSLPRSASAVDVSRFCPYGRPNVPPPSRSADQVSQAQGRQPNNPLNSVPWVSQDSLAPPADSTTDHHSIRNEPRPKQRLKRVRQALNDRFTSPSVSNLGRANSSQVRLPAINEMSAFYSTPPEDYSDTESIEARVLNDPDGEELMKTSARMQNLENFADEADRTEKKQAPLGIDVIEASPKLQKFFGTNENEPRSRNTASCDDRKVATQQSGSPRARLSRSRPKHEVPDYYHKSKATANDGLHGLGLSEASYTAVPEDTSPQQVDPHYYEPRQKGQPFNCLKSPFVQHSNVMEFAEPPAGFSMPPLTDSASSQSSYVDASSELYGSRELLPSPSNSPPASPSKRDGIAMARTPLKRLNTTEYEFVPERFRYFGEVNSTPDSERPTPRASAVPSMICSRCHGSGVEPTINEALVYRRRSDGEEQEDEHKLEYYDPEVIGRAF